MNTTGKIQKLTDRKHFWNEIVDLDRIFFPTPWKKEEWESLDLGQHGLWVFLENGRPLGFALFSTPQDETAHLLKILITPDHRGSGMAEAFWKLLAGELKSMSFLNVYLEVEESNERARAFYEKLGFKLLRRVKSYYSSGETGLMMQLTL